MNEAQQSSKNCGASEFVLLGVLPRDAKKGRPGGRPV